jgi:hypothetical protein
MPAGRLALYIELNAIGCWISDQKSRLHGNAISGSGKSGYSIALRQTASHDPEIGISVAVRKPGMFVFI